MDRSDMEEIRRLAALRSPAMMGRYIRGREFALRPHTRVIDDALRDLGQGTDRLLVTLPPRSGKSELIARLLPLWWLARHPAEPIALASYAASLAIGHSRAVRRMVAEYGAPFGLFPQVGQQAVYDWAVTAGGGVRATGVGGGLTGHGAGLVVADDVIKDRQEADSRLYRERVWGWWSAVLLSRLRPASPVCLVMTRWHTDDIAARVLDQEGRIEEGGRWRVIEIEAIATGLHPDPLGREPGEPLSHPLIDDDDRDALLAHWEEKRRTSIPRDWAAIYQGSPVVAEGALVDGALMADRTQLTGHPEPVRAAVAIDPSGGGKDSAGVVAGYLGADNRVWVTHDRTRVMPSDQWARVACLLAVETDADRISYEKNYGGDLVPIAIRTAWESLVKEGAVPDGMRMPYLHHVTARKGKFLRAEPVAQMLREDKWRLGAHLPELVAEWINWRPGDTDSPGRIDACVYLVRDLMPTPGGTTGVASAAGVNREVFKGPGGIVRRPY
jgi:hypothetical protein